MVNATGWVRILWIGKLYLDVGEHANGPDAQLPTHLLGKVLRMNPNETVPSDNPL